MFTPTSSPSAFKSGPPELPGFSGASVCTRSSKVGESGTGSRSELVTTEITPAVELMSDGPGYSPWSSFSRLASRDLRNFCTSSY